MEQKLPKHARTSLLSTLLQKAAEVSRTPGPGSASTLRSASGPWSAPALCRLAFCLIPLMVLGPGFSSHGDELRVDLSRSGRRDTAASHFIEWQVNPENPSTNFGAIKVTLRAVSGKLEGGLYKSAIDYGARLACDGIITSRAGRNGALELVISGLAPGAHRIATYHNSTWPAERSCGPFELFVNGALARTNIQPSVQVTNDYDIASTYTQVLAEPDNEVVLRFQTIGTATNVILNGFEIDTSDPTRKAIKPSPANDEEHVDADSGFTMLTWTAPASAVSHHIYFGEDAAAVASADLKSPLFKGNQTSIGYRAANLNHFGTWFWRVDEQDSSGKITKGELWRFRTRRLAFPTAEGYGRFARGGRGGRVIEVTNLEDYDPTKGEAVIPGSFRSAVEAEGPRTIVFRVSGLIRLKRPCAVSKPYCTIAGQTAPGDGICLANYSSGAFGSHDVIIRFMRFRIGDYARKAMDGAGLGSSDHCIMDHCTISWSSDEGTSSRGARNITFQRNIVSEALHHSYHYRASDRSKFETHAFAGSISGNTGSYHHNLLAHCTDRNWSLAGGYNQAGIYAGFLDIRNNVVYNWTSRTTDGGVAKLNYVNNYYKPYANNPFVKWLLKLDPIDPARGTTQYFMSGNVMEGFDYESDNWKAFHNGSAVEKLVRVDGPLFESYVQTQTAREAFTNVLANVGATFPRQDVIDRRIIEEVRTGTTHYSGTKGPGYGDRPSPNFPGIIDEPTDNKDAQGSVNFPWPEYRTYNVPTDSDHDGMPDDWEMKSGLNPKDPADGNLVETRDGYTNLEKYLGWLVGEFPEPKPTKKSESQL